MKKTLATTALRSNGADFVRTYHHVEVGPDVTVEDILKPAFWAHHVSTLRAGDLIDILSEDGGIDMQVRVTGKGVGYVEVRPLRVWQRADKAAAAEPEAVNDDDVPAGYTVNFAPRQKFRVWLKEPSEMIAKDIPTRAEAIRIAVEHAAKANAVAA